MCRLMIVTGELKRESVIGLLTETARKFAPTQRDGFGFATFNSQGHLTARGQYFERYTGWHNPNPSSQVKEEGQIGSRTHTLIIHGRTSTNIVGVDYCHPFRRADSVLAHNGILTYKGDAAHRPTHRNDSAAFLQWLVEQEYPSLDHVTANWGGYGAIAHMRHGHGLSLIKCDKARLTITPRKGSGYVMTTFGGDVPERYRGQDQQTKILGKVALEFDSNSGEIIRAREFKGFQHREWDARAERSIGSYPNYSNAKQGSLWAKVVKRTNG